MLFEWEEGDSESEESRGRGWGREDGSSGGVNVFIACVRIASPYLTSTKADVKDNVRRFGQDSSMNAEHSSDT